MPISFTFFRRDGERFGAVVWCALNFMTAWGHLRGPFRVMRISFTFRLRDGERFGAAPMVPPKGPL